MQIIIDNTKERHCQLVDDANLINDMIDMTLVRAMIRSSKAVVAQIMNDSHLFWPGLGEANATRKNYSQMDPKGETL